MLTQEASSIFLNDVLTARRRLNGFVIETPLTKSRWLGSLSGAAAFLKLENLQVTNSFKFRGALNCLSWARDNDIHKVFTASAGNHGLGVAEAAQITNLDATVCIPTNASSIKRKRLRSYNIALIEHGTDWDAVEAYARRMSKEKKAFYVSAYNNEQIIAGAATIALEMLENHPDLNIIVCPVGGGGLIAGIGLAAKAINPKIRIVGAVAANSPAMMQCVKAGRIVPTPIDQTIADGLAGNIEEGSITFPIAKNTVDEWVSVEEEDIAATVFEFLDNEGMLIEGSSAVAVAAVSRKLFSVSPKDQIGVVVSGGNIARSVWHDICSAHLK